jgi:hypothetical protein
MQYYTQKTGIIKFSRPITEDISIKVSVQTINGSVWVYDTIYSEGQYTPKATNMYDLQGEN